MTETKMVLCRAGQSKASGEDKSQVFEEERLKKKLIYIRMLEHYVLGYHHWWLVGNPYVDDPANFFKDTVLELHRHDPDYKPGYFCNDEDDKKHRYYPQGFLEHRGYGIVSLDSKIYFMGGFLKSSDDPSNKIFVFDTQRNVWDKTYSMKEKRAYPNVFSYGNRVYALGYQCQYVNYPPESYPLPPSHWAEFFDVDSRQSYYVSAPPPEKFTLRRLYLTPAIDHAREKVYFCLLGRCLFGYSFKDEDWFIVKLPENLYSLNPIINWSASVVVIRSILFLNYYGTIYGYDLSDDDFSNPRPVPMCNLPGASMHFGPPYGSISHPTSFLVNAGNGTLCLVHGFDTSEGEPFVWCHRFQVLYSPALNQVEVTYQDTQSHPLKGSLVVAVLELSYTGGANKKGKVRRRKNKKKNHNNLRIESHC